MNEPDPGKTREELYAALREIGRLCRWVGWAESGLCVPAGQDMRKIMAICEEMTGWHFEELT